MSSADAVDPQSAATRTIAAAVAAGPSFTVLIDGPSGSGKSTLADRILAAWPTELSRPQLLRLDDVYPGWRGLQPARRSVREGVLEPRTRGRDGRWQRWDWIGDRGAEWHPVAAVAPLIVEGCGAFAGDDAAAGALRIWIESPDPVRKARALARDDGAFDAHWDDWQQQWSAYLAAERPEAAAHIVVDGG